MQLKQLYKDYNDENDEGRTAMVRTYRERRSKEFEDDQRDYERRQRKSANKRRPALVLSDEEKILIKKMGLTQAQVRALRAATTEEE